MMNGAGCARRWASRNLPPTHALPAWRCASATNRSWTSIITQWTSTRGRWDTARLLQKAGVAAIPTLTATDLFEDPHLRERNFFVRLPHPEVGARAHPGPPWKMSVTPCEIQRPGPVLGADTDDVLSSLLGLSAEQISGLRKDEVLL